MSENVVEADVESASQDSKETLNDRATLDLFVTVLGFGLCRAWIVFCLGAPLVMYTHNTSVHWVYLVLGAMSALVIGLWVGKHSAREQSVAKVLYVLTPILLIVSGVVLPWSLATQLEAAMIVGLIIAGVAAGALQVLWGSHFACNGLYFAELASPGAAIVTALIVALAAGTTNFLGFAVIPLVSYGLLVFAALRFRDAEYMALMAEDLKEMPIASVGLEDSAKTWTQRLKAVIGRLTRPAGLSTERSSEPGDFGLGKLVISTVVFTALCRLFDAIPRQADPLAFIGGSTIFSLIVVGAAFIAIVLRWKNRFNPMFTYRLSLPIMVTGFVAIALFADSHAALSLLLINIGYEFFDVLVWVLFAAVALRPQESSLRVYGFGVAAMFAGMALGNELGYLLDMLVAQGSVQMTMVAMCCTLCLVVVAFLVLPEGTLVSFTEGVLTKNRDQRDKAALENKKATAAQEQAMASEGDTGVSFAGVQPARLELQCLKVAKKYSLTPREQEVLVLLAHGRTLSIIARDLYIAKGTARTHIENIYRKLDVHKQQELIDLVEHYECE